MSDYMPVVLVVVGLVSLVTFSVVKMKSSRKYIENKYNLQNKNKQTITVKDGTQVKQGLGLKGLYMWRESDELSFVSMLKIGDFGKLSFHVNDINYYKNNYDDSKTSELSVNIDGSERKMIFEDPARRLGEFIPELEYHKITGEREERHLSRYNPKKHIITKVCMYNPELLHLGMEKSVRHSMWKEDRKLMFISSDAKDDYGKVEIEIDKIKFFKRYGDVYSEQTISGGGSNYGRAVVGGIIAGGAGAIIASREEITSDTMRIDERQTIMCIDKDGQDTYINFMSEDYEELMYFIPEKEISMVGR